MDVEGFFSQWFDEYRHHLDEVSGAILSSSRRDDEGSAFDPSSKAAAGAGWAELNVNSDPHFHGR